MKVGSFEREGHARLISVSLGNDEYLLPVERATELRDALTRELGASQALTGREAMVWAAEFVRAMAEGQKSHDAALSACSAVWVIRELGGTISEGNGAAVFQAMLAAMTGGGR